jgi:glycosyltransferase involved in cell wall biosynthesis
MNILVAITYYRPHMSGLTIYAERLAKSLVKHGHSVTILTSQFSPDLPLHEEMEGVKIVRVPVLVRISKGVVMPSFGTLAGKLLKKHDVVHLHLPQFDAVRVAIRAWFRRKPVVMTYHCDLRLPKGIFNWFVNQVVLLLNNLAAVFSDRIVTYTRDYAEHSRFVMRFKKKLRVINPPVDLPSVQEKEIALFRATNNKDENHPIIGMAARFASEKGVEVLLEALADILKKYPKTQVWFAGPYENILGEQGYYERLKPLIDEYVSKKHWKFLGLLSPREMALFYPNLDILTIPSLNSTEAFGLIQIEAMMNGVPSIASNLPGVRQPVMRHDMGEIIEIGNSQQLAEAVDNIMQNRAEYTKNWQKIAEQYNPGSVAKTYELLYQELLDRS